MNWKDTITTLSARVLQKRYLSVFAARCGRSNPISFVLRPMVAHRNLRGAVGVNLALLVGFLAIYGPLPSFAGDSTGGRLEINVHSEGEVNLATNQSVQLPVTDFRLTQGYNWYHPGIDMAAPIGQPVYPVMAGTVATVEYGRFGYGNNIVLFHAKGYSSRYAHLSKIEVAEGQTVKLNTEIGQVGSTGHSTGPHLHLEIYSSGETVNPKTVLGLN